MFSELQKSNVTLDTVLALLETKAAQSEEASDAIADNFLKGKTDVDEFLEEFSKERKLMHLRKVKVDKMGELMRKKQQSETSAMNNPSMPAFSFYPPQFPPSAVRPMIYPPGPAQVPYPLANMPMPMPMSRMTPKNPYF